jgi:hypothetical protein
MVEHISKREKAVEFLVNDIKKLEKLHEIKYSISRYSFVLGILAVAASRSLAAVQRIVNG